MDTISLAMGLATGLALGGLLTGLLVSSRLRGQVQSRLIESAERAQRAACEAAELRKLGELDRAELSHVREMLAAASHAQAVAETRAEETTKHLEEQKTLLAQARHELTETFKALSGDALKTNNEAFLSLAKSSFETLRAEATGELSQRHQAIDDLVKPLHGALQRYEDQVHQMERSRQSAYGGLDQHLKQLADSHQRLQQETSNLVKALRAPNIRGRWGEITLKRVAELAGMVPHCDFFEQETVTTDEGRLRPDMVIRLPGGRQIVVDAKAVLSAYLEAHETPDDGQRLEHFRRHATQVRTRMDQLSAKAYWNQFAQTPEIVVLFLPGEHFLAAAQEHDPALTEDGFARRVILATPNTLIALLHAAAYGWRQEQLSQSAQQAGQLGKDLYERMSVLAEHLSTIGQALTKSVQTYNKAVGSLETRIFPAARKFKELGIASDKDLPLLEALEVAPRAASIDQ
ncbi:MAG TPA: DNA recombination protein RmuC [Nitrospiraceae bacterium]|nr:DNA recombination protein RmuC [Nitrospiraceae bacterium]